ncbi:3-keto-steroid reductase [Monascus purpureus]|uniref:3-keto-steroid reductase n=1 Tax=Monascus purpureus TaxID=5098 RepID=A0A507QIA5_MONPU|nr:3-keto-steroid reductase [Monascus purpureus]BDD58383.1 hypothetical protein MAP00_003663 [Monascus purpureus]
MTASNSPPGLKDRVFVLVTGANSGLGYSICCRLIDEFLQNKNRPQSQGLTVIFTTRSTRKGNDTLARLSAHLTQCCSSDPQSLSRVTFVSENVDLSNLVSVRALSRRLLRTIPKLDAIILNAGLGGWTGIDWPRAVWGVTTDLVHQVSWPSYKLGQVGVLNPLQIPAEKMSEEEPRLGAIFCANVFGHYMLAHNVVPLLKRSSSSLSRDGVPGRIIWVSSLEATTSLFDVNDIQGLRSETPYESSKALTDILALTSNLPSTAPWVNSFYSTTGDQDKKDEEHENPTMYLSHPGICGTGILPLSLPLFYLMICAFWMARFLGSPWHTLSTYLGASAPVWLALSSQTDLDDAESPYARNDGGRVKWGSSCDRFGRGQPASTEIDGWGHGGVVGPAIVEADRARRRKRGTKDLTVEEKERFVELGRLCWMQMEELRILWDGILDRAGV